MRQHRRDSFSHNMTLCSLKRECDPVALVDTFVRKPPSRRGVSEFLKPPSRRGGGLPNFLKPPSRRGGGFRVSSSPLGGSEFSQAPFENFSQAPLQARSEASLNSNLRTHRPPPHPPHPPPKQARKLLFFSASTGFEGQQEIKGVEFE